MVFYDLLCLGCPRAYSINYERSDRYNKGTVQSLYKPVRDPPEGTITSVNCVTKGQLFLGTILKKIVRKWDNFSKDL